jgi:hypothetical protein
LAEAISLVEDVLRALDEKALSWGRP